MEAAHHREPSPDGRAVPPAPPAVGPGQEIPAFYAARSGRSFLHRVLAGLMGQTIHAHRRTWC
ncbi:unnamed protein product [Linum tenue]|uniref:Uncharacterized protein n=1 Tax=Linum tenue TaxID=586396 RepID=A0AAV0PCD5_9ROSI|nr:unnamed protein product [Linum tenue]